MIRMLDRAERTTYNRCDGLPIRVLAEEPRPAIAPVPRKSPQFGNETLGSHPVSTEPGKAATPDGYYQARRRKAARPKLPPPATESDMLLRCPLPDTRSPPPARGCQPKIKAAPLASW